MRFLPLLALLALLGCTAPDICADGPPTGGIGGTGNCQEDR